MRTNGSALSVIIVLLCTGCSAVDAPSLKGLASDAEAIKASLDSDVQKYYDQRVKEIDLITADIKFIQEQYNDRIDKLKNRTA